MLLILTCNKWLPKALSGNGNTAGVSEMEGARWDDAIASFSQTLQILMKDPPGPATQQKQAFAGQYLAAVTLLKASGAGATATEAKLYRQDMAVQDCNMLVRVMHVHKLACHHKNGVCLQKYFSPSSTLWRLRLLSGQDFSTVLEPSILTRFL